MKKKLHKLIFGEELEFQEQIFRVLLILCAVIVTITTIEGFAIGAPIEYAVPLLILAVTDAFAIVCTFGYRRYKIATYMVGLVLNGIVLPAIFLFSGGIDGGAAVWMMMGMFYISLMFSGKVLVFFFLYTIAIDALTYMYAYLNPEVITPIGGEWQAYLDSLFSICIVGFTASVIMKMQSFLHNRERQITIEQGQKIQAFDESRSAFYASMSHEIRTPINTIVGLNEMILREDVSEEVRENAENIMNASKMLLTLVNDILDLSQLESNKMKIVPVEYDTKEAIGEVVSMISVRMREKNLDFSVNLDENLPTSMYGDRKRINQVVLNLLTNAVKYTNEGSVALNVRAEKLGEEWIKLFIEVRDTGIGIKADDLGCLFDTFARVDRVRNSAIEGAGLGLAISKNLVDLMGGRIMVDSIYTKGSTFTLELEQRVVNAEPIGIVNLLTREKIQKVQTYKQSFEAPEANILFVDDNEMNLMVAAKLLRATRVQVDTAKSGVEALRKTREKTYHLIFMDYLMPEMDGIETFRKIRRQENGMCRNTPVIVLTAGTDSEGEHTYMKQGFDGYLEKPIVGAVLEEKIMEFLPNELIDQRSDVISKKEMVEALDIYVRKKKLLITTDSACDLPEEYLKKFEIQIIPQYIMTENGRFRDGKEIDLSNISRWRQDKMMLRSMSATVQEYTEFFGDALTQAEEIIHISIADNLGNCYKNAIAAAKGFAHVHIIDSGSLSGGQGIIALYAGRMAREGKTYEEILKEVEFYREKVKTNLLISDVHLYKKKGFLDGFSEAICTLFNAKPVIFIKNGELNIGGAYLGKLDYCYIRFLNRTLLRRNMDDEVIFITHGGLTVKQQEALLEEVRARMPFKNVIIQRASAFTVCNGGTGSLGITYITK